MIEETIEGRHPGQVSVTGLLTPAEWDELGSVTQVMLEWDAEHDDDPGEILLSPEGAGRSLLEFVGRVATVSGVVELGEDGASLLRVTGFRLHRTRPFRLAS